MRRKPSKYLKYRFNPVRHTLTLELSHEELECLSTALSLANDEEKEARKPKAKGPRVWLPRNVKRARLLERRLDKIEGEIGLSPESQKEEDAVLEEYRRDPVLSRII